MLKIAILVGVLSSILLPAPARAQLVPDLTGTWEGKWTCKSFDGVKFSEKNKESVLQITQTGTTFAADIDNGGFLYNGELIPDNKNAADKPGKAEGILAQCGTNNVPLAGSEAELIRASVKTKPNVVKASFKGLSIFENGDPSLGTCKYSYKRTSPTTNATINACP